MNRSAALATALAAALATTVGLAGTADAAGHAQRDVYGTKTPYAPQQSLKHYQQIPKGYTAVFTENVARHGSRAMSDSEDGDAVLALLDTASARGGLTDLGAELAPQVRTLLAAGANLGYGNLSALGADEQRQTALRMEQRLPGLFDTIAAQGEPIVVETSGVARATASANAFTAGLTAGEPALATLITAPRTDKNLLYFHKQPQNADYQAYVAHDPDLAAVLATVDGNPRTAEAARHTAQRLFAPAFLATLTADQQLAFARSLYALYSAAPDLAVEAPGASLDRFLTPRDAQWFAYLDDAEEFYSKGPGFSGRTITYKMAGVLLDDLFAQAEAKAAGTTGTGAVLRFTHAEEIEPLAALLGLPGSTLQADPAQPYTYLNNPWRGAEVSPMAANLQWDLYRAAPDTKGKPAHLVRMLYNEKETAFKDSCHPITKGSYFYDLTELERCFGRG
ncbi:histidine-type phosphatase [Streptomyces sp. TLI_171]|uniref:histidine-type phosphatase n=1 Tax=Streptomyces sp. TLI_171 TaxID=1938859 RepID=UPI000C18040A|nr:histidine-type phosphatase [Streptomyces sp. TLI_171]RKE16940.1 histidine phosphatase superfamily protein (branch 2) [Streptomyces sp. TLI_171]